MFFVFFYLQCKFIHPLFHVPRLDFCPMKERFRAEFKMFGLRKSQKLWVSVRQPLIVM